MIKKKFIVLPLIMLPLSSLIGHCTYTSYRAHKAYVAHRYNKAMKYSQVWKDYSCSLTELYWRSYLQKVFKNITTKSIEDQQCKGLSRLNRQLRKNGGFDAYRTSPSYRILFNLNEYNENKIFVPDQTTTLESIVWQIKKISASNEKNLLVKMHYLQINTQFQMCTAMLEYCTKEPFGIYEYKDRIIYFTQEIEQGKKYPIDQLYVSYVLKVYDNLITQMSQRLAMYPHYDATQGIINITLPILLRSAQILDKSLYEITEYYAIKQVDSKEIKNTLDMIHKKSEELLTTYNTLGYDILGYE